MEYQVERVQKGRERVRHGREALRQRSARLRRQSRALLRLARGAKLEEGELGRAVCEIVEVAARTLRTGRVGVWLFTPDRSRMRCMDLFETTSGRHAEAPDLGALDYPAYFTALQEDRTLAVHEARTDPRTREFTEGYLQPLGITSMLDVPIRVAGEMIGVVCHEHIGPPRRWTLDESSFAGSIGDFVALAVASSERAKADRERANSETRFRSLIENALDAVVIVDRKGKISYCSPSVERVLGYAPVEALGRDQFDFIHPDDLPALRELHAETVATPGAIRSAEPRFLHANGEWRWVRSTAHNLLDDEAVGGIVINFRDITDRKQAEELQRRYSRDLEAQVAERTRELRRTQADLILREKLASLGRLVAGLAHEINTPIGAIASAADLSDAAVSKLSALFASAESLEAMRADPYFQELLAILGEDNRIVAAAADRVAGIVRSLRNFARLDEAERKMAELHEGIESTLTLLQHQLNRVVVVKDYGKLPQIQCYPNQLNQVFLSLLMNAAEALQGPGTITIRTWAEAKTASVRVSDTGRGIAPEHLDRIFEPGFTTKGVGLGTGLGLALSYNIVQRHQGKILVESQLGRGTAFTVVLPVD